MLAAQGILEQIIHLDYTPLVLAIVLGGLVGLQREIHGRPAGVRTHMLVCLAATVLILSSAHYAPKLARANIVFDPQRLAAGILTGIGFLGAAAVVRSGDLVRGITTGACVWAVAGLGVVIGHGAYGLAIATTVGFLFVLICIDWITGGIPAIKYRRLLVTGETTRIEALHRELQEILKGHRVRVQEMTGRLEGASGPFRLVFHVRCRDNFEPIPLIEKLSAQTGVKSVEWTSVGR